MTSPDLNNLRALLDEYERYAGSIPASRSGAGSRMLEVIAEARRLLRPSADGTANFVESKSIVERLSILKNEAEANEGVRGSP